MLVKLTGGKVHDPANGINGEVRDIFVEDDRVASPMAGAGQNLHRCAGSPFAALVNSREIWHGFA